MTRSAKTLDKPSMVIAINRKMYEALIELVQTGLWGDNVFEAAERIIADWLWKNKVEK